jgi:hypothetical protein
MIPVRHRGHDEVVEILEDGVVRLAFIRRRARQGIGQIARLHLRNYGIIASVLEIMRDPVDDFVAGAAEVFDVGVPLLLLGAGRHRTSAGHKGSWMKMSHSL